MGRALAGNFADRGVRVVGWDAGAEARAQPATEFVVAKSVAELVERLRPPRTILLMVPAGPAVDTVLEALVGLLQVGDIIADGGNSNHRDTVRRAREIEARGLGYLGLGISGGEAGARHGPSIMAGGSAASWQRIGGILTDISAKYLGEPCAANVGPDGAGHFVKTMHNGIEYADMQMIAEICGLVRDGENRAPAKIAELFKGWNAGPLKSYLVEITAVILAATDPETARPMVDVILDRAGQKGTGRWTAEAALEAGVALPTVSAAVDARVQSAQVERRRLAASLLNVGATPSIDGITIDDLRDALYASKIASYTQGFDLLARASEERDYGTDLAEVARIWKAGCIIRARFLDRVRAAFSGDGATRLLALAPDFRSDLADCLPSWRRTVAGAIGVGIPVPGLSASLAWFDTLTTAKGSTNLIQAQRDYFGSHTYERVDAPGEFEHADWKNAARRH